MWLRKDREESVVPRLDEPSIGGIVERGLLSLAGMLVNQPDAVTLEVVVTKGRVVMCELDCAPEDKAYVIGRGGRNADSIRLLFSAICARFGYRFFLSIVESRGRNERAD